ncbi:hypothetical protein I33_0590 [Bacillus subtilis subsp. subtilis str. RO-NN-1]|nr:hypothetical protein I33_0590 [Bacillus subtilis subsp. subtilis str. RO-NN-1]
MRCRRSAICKVRLIGRMSKINESMKNTKSLRLLVFFMLLRGLEPHIKK